MILSCSTKNQESQKSQLAHDESDHVMTLMRPSSGVVMLECVLNVKQALHRNP